MQVVNFFEWLDRHSRSIQRLAIPLLITTVIATAFLVYLTGGIKYAYSHFMYIPIVLAGIIYGAKGGIITAVAAGLVLGPFIPISTESGELQQTTNWLYRAGLFIFIGALFGVISDAVRQYLQHIIHLSHYDNATNLRNRQALLTALKELSTAEQQQLRLLLVISPDQAREFKAAFGYTVIDTFIEQIAPRFSEVLPETASIYRADSEEIAILLHKIKQPDIPELLDNLRSIFSSPFLYEGIPLHVNPRIGYTTFSRVTNPELHLRQAESALIVAHQKLQNYVEYKPEGRLVIKETLSVLGELMTAINKEQLSLHFQPKINLHTGQIEGVEALMRWQHPKRGNVPPTKFIHCAEQSTLIHPITYFAIEQAIKTILYFHSSGIWVPIAVNISSHNLMQQGFADKVLALLNKYDVETHYLELEITETALIRDIAQCIDELQKLARAGVSIAIDDFGTGYSSLQYLHQLPISHLKIDQSFVQNLPANTDSKPILEAAVSMAHKMNLKIIAEGVENKAAFDTISLIGCDALQGYYIAKPMPQQQFIDWYNQFQQTGLAGLSG